MVVSLNYHRRHGRNCEGKHPAGTYTSQSEERKKGWARCKCLIYASGSLDRIARRFATKQSDWQKAAELMAPYIAANSWRVAEPAAAPIQTNESDTLQDRATVATIEEACLAWLAAKQNRHVAGSTMKKYRTFTNQLRAFAKHCGCLRLAEFKVTDCDRFYGTWKDGNNSKGKKLERMKGFFEFCLKRRWIAENPAQSLEAPVKYAQHKQKSPFTDEELNRIFRAAAEWKTCAWHNAGSSGRITAEQVITFAMLLTETGLRISDAATFNVADRINPQTRECFLFMHKTGKPLSIWINPDLYARLQALAVEFGPTPFITQSLNKEQASDAWRERLSKVFTAAGPFAEHPVPHRFRHTFVRVQLQRGVSVDDVAELIGDTPEMVRRHYARWVPERQNRLTAIMKVAYEDSLKHQWRGHVIPIQIKQR